MSWSWAWSPSVIQWLSCTESGCLCLLAFRSMCSSKESLLSCVTPRSFVVFRISISVPWVVWRVDLTNSGERHWVCFKALPHLVRDRFLCTLGWCARDFSASSLEECSRQSPEFPKLLVLQWWLIAQGRPWRWQGIFSLVLDSRLSTTRLQRNGERKPSCGHPFIIRMVHWDPLSGLQAAVERHRMCCVEFSAK